jgi:hypothetical protein
MKPVIEDLNIEPEQLQELNAILNSTSNQSIKRAAMMRIAGRGCVVCGIIPTKIVKYKLEDITRVERYCSQHFERWLADEEVILTATNGIDQTIAERDEKRKCQKVSVK